MQSTCHWIGYSYHLHVHTRVFVERAREGSVRKANHVWFVQQPYPGLIVAVFMSHLSSDSRYHLCLSLSLRPSIYPIACRTQFIRVILVGHELTPFELVDGIRQIPDQLLFTYQGRLLHSRMGHPLASPVIFPLHNAIHSRQNGDMTSREIESDVVEDDSRMLDLESPTVKCSGIKYFIFGCCVSWILSTACLIL